jgi:hypothetical protein
LSLLLPLLLLLLLLQSHLSTRRYGTVTHMPPEVRRGTQPRQA